MDLTRYWRARHNGTDIEVQWTGVRFQDGWTLRLLVEGQLKAAQKVGRFANNFELKDGPITITFWGKMFRHRCKISAEGKVLADSFQPWNALAFFPICVAVLMMAINVVVLISLRAAR